MNHYFSLFQHRLKFVSEIIAIGILAVVLSSCGAPASLGSRATAQAALDPENWRQAMQQVPLPKLGCFLVTYPGSTWQEVACATAPAYPQQAGSNSQFYSVGNGKSYAAQIQGNISSAVGSFDAVTGLTSESGTAYGPGCANPMPGVSNTYTLQINSNVFSTTEWGCDQRKGCKGWQQFVYSNTGKAYIQDWLIDYGTPCPTGWTADGDDCYLNKNAASIPVQPIDNLAQLSLAGMTTPDTNTVILSIQGSPEQATDQLFAVAQEDILNLAQGWNSAEFNVFGDGCTSAADFNVGTALKVRVAVSGNESTSITCLAAGYTEETNNLDLRSCSSFGAAGSPAGIVFLEDNQAAVLLKH